MGIGNSAVQIASGTLFTGQFRFVAELGKGLSVGEMGITIEYFSVKGSFRGVELPATDDQAVMLKLIEAQRFKNINIFFPLSGVGFKAGLELSEIFELRSPFFVSIAIHKKINGNKAGIYVLRDNQATLLSSPFPISDEKLSKIELFMTNLTLPSAELSQVSADGSRLQKV